MILVVNKKKCVFFLLFRNFKRFFNSLFLLLFSLELSFKRKEKSRLTRRYRVLDDVTYCCAQMSIDFDYL